VRASALAARSSVQADEALLRGASTDPSPLVRATAAVGLVAGGWVSDEAHHVLDALLRERDPDALMALARAIERRPSPAFEEVLLQLVELPRTDVQSQAARAMAAVRSEHFLPALLPLLMARDVRPAARAAFRAHGDAALTFLEQALLDSALPREIRSHVPRTISRFDSQAAVDVLMRRLLPETDGAVRYKMIRGLGRMAADHPELEFDARILREAVARTLEAAARLLTWRVALEQGKLDNPRRATAGHDLLVALIHDKQSHALERVFRLLGLLNRSEDLRRIYRGLRSPQPKVQAGSRELLESLLRPPRREEVLALIDSRPPGAGRPGVPAAPLPAYEAVLVELLEQPSETMRCLAAYHVGELGLSDLRERLTRLDLASSGFFVSRVIERALKMLDASRASLAHAP